MLAYRARQYPRSIVDGQGDVASSSTAARVGGAIADAQPRQVEFYSANTEIYAQGDRATALYQVEYGVVRLFRLLSDGRRQICAFHVAGEVFGFDVDGQHHLFAEAVCNAAIRIYRRPLREDSTMLSLALKELVRAQEHLIVIGRQTAAERIAAFVVDLYERLDGARSFELAMSRSDIADYLGLTIETVSRVFSKFRSAGYIRLTGTRGLDIVQVDALKRLCA
jgi:CRP/FNR family nitrogen fixation transcriptional regulator